MSNTVECKSVKIKIYNSIGTEVLSKEYSNVTNEVDINFANLNLASGIYMVNIITDKGNINKKLIIK